MWHFWGARYSHVPDARVSDLNQGLKWLKLVHISWSSAVYPGLDWRPKSAMALAF